MMHHNGFSGTAPPSHFNSGTFSNVSGGGQNFSTLTPNLRQQMNPSHYHGPGMSRNVSGTTTTLGLNNEPSFASQYLAQKTNSALGGGGGTPSSLMNNSYHSSAPPAASASHGSGTPATQPQTYHGGISLQLQNLDFTDDHMTNSLLHAADVRVTVNSTHLIAFCTTRRVDVLRIAFTQVSSVDRKMPADDRGAGSTPALQVDYAAASAEATFMPGASATRQLRCLVFNKSQEFIDTMFHATLARWSFARVATDSYNYGNQTVPVTPPAFTHQAAPNRIPAAAVGSGAPAPAFNSMQHSGYHHPIDSWQSQIANSATMNDSQGYIRMGAAAETTPRQSHQHSAPPVMNSSHMGGVAADPSQYHHQQQHQPPLEHWAASQVDQRAHTVTMTDLETELHMIQQRRRQRQPWLVSSDEAHGALYALDALAGSAVTPRGGKVSSRLSARKEQEVLNLSQNSDLGGGTSPVGGVSPRVSNEWPSVGELRALAAMRKQAQQAKRAATSAQESKEAAARAAKEAALERQRKLREEQEEERKRAKQQTEDLGTVVHEFGREGGLVYEGATRRCVWCNKYAPKSHDGKCTERRILCNVCHQEIYLRDKEAHRAKCVSRDNPQKQQRIQQKAELRELKEQLRKEKDSHRRAQAVGESASPRSSGSSRGVRFN